ncbi:MFS transporter [Paramylibacter ulvae]|nr:MFS transporter [Amylibacter ulvae]
MTDKSKKIWGWMMYDWAAQPYNTLLITFIFAPYFTGAVVGDPVQGQALWGLMMGIVGVCLALGAPILGAISDHIGPRRPWLLFFSFLYVVGSFGLWWAMPNMDSVTMILILFGIGVLGMEWSQVFANSMLPEMGDAEELGRISGNGWAWGYAGGIISLVIMLLLLAENEEGKTLLGRAPLFGLDTETRQGTRMVGPLTAVWYAVFMIPFFIWVPDRVRRQNVTGGIAAGLSSLWETIKTLPNNISLSAYLASSMFYRDALVGVFAFGGIYAEGVLGWSIIQIGIFGIVAAFGAMVFTYLGGFIDKRIGPKRTIALSIAVLIAVCTVIIAIGRDSFFGVPLAEGSTLPDKVFMFCGAVLGGFGGVLQASSRHMMVHQASPERMTEAFGLYGLAGKATSFIAPSTIGLVTHITQNQRLGMVPVVILFLIGLCLLFWVESKEG